MMHVIIAATAGAAATMRIVFPFQVLALYLDMLFVLFLGYLFPQQLAQLIVLLWAVLDSTFAME
jgi:hypothetical protein